MKALEKAFWISFVNALGFSKDKTYLEAKDLNQMLQMHKDLQNLNFGTATTVLLFIYFPCMI